MNDKNRSIISKIKEDEEKKYNINFQMETPNVVTYFKNNLKRGNFSLKRIKKLLLSSIKYEGIAIPDISYICVFDKNINELKAVRVALHEIRHVIQEKREDLFSAYENFCINYLSSIDNYSYLYNQFHNDLYNEIDANMYAGENGIKYFKNEESITYFERLFNINFYRQNIYDFDYFFEVFLNQIEDKGFNDDDPVFKYRDYISIYFNQDGSLKSVKEIINNPSFDISSKLAIKILSSNAFLENIDFNNIDDIERKILFKTLLTNTALLLNSERINEKIYQENKITYKEYKEGSEKINKMILDKKTLIEKINKKRGIKK